MAYARLGAAGIEAYDNLLSRSGDMVLSPGVIMGIPGLVMSNIGNLLGCIGINHEKWVDLLGCIGIYPLVMSNRKLLKMAQSK